MPFPWAATHSGFPVAPKSSALTRVSSARIGYPRGAAVDECEDKGTIDVRFHTRICDALGSYRGRFDPELRDRLGPVELPVWKLYERWRKFVPMDGIVCGTGSHISRTHPNYARRLLSAAQTPSRRRLEGSGRREHRG